jgi:seryl-tRNA synthetase
VTYNYEYTTFSTFDSIILENLDNDFISLLSGYKINKWFIPALIDGETLRRCGYFSTLPNHLTCVGHIKKDKINEVITNNKVTAENIDNKFNYFLTPAACIHFYPILEKEYIYNEIITTRARVYRYEDGKYEVGRRLWDFTVREFVAVGSVTYVKSFLDFLAEKLLQYAKTYSNKVQLIEANDHFYPTKENQMREKYQLSNSLKRELIVNINDSDLAVSSINYHAYHFSKEFKFDNNEEVVTGCVGCGLERWLYFVQEGKKFEPIGGKMTEQRDKTTSALKLTAVESGG